MWVEMMSYLKLNAVSGYTLTFAAVHTVITNVGVLFPPMLLLILWLR